MEDSQEEQVSQAQKSLNDSLARGSAFQEMIRTKGWEFVKKFYENKIQSFVTGMIISEEKDIAEFEPERREIIGLRKLLGSVDNDIKNLEENRDKEKGDGGSAPQQ